jgi:site-specific recombinase XerD
MKKRLRRELMRASKQAGFPDVTKLHTMRHTFASQLVMSGVDLATVRALLGHADIETTMIYAHLAPEHLKNAVEKLAF